ncbi:sugar phosphate isomerase/epimerase family protein [Absicoccus intestinalis]|uniref:Sugar phosphate isomerase/epimerase n=1 Tax=Absicoccus intestinalis TaxID=2926319 RepID=A0ABU4WLZ9_9FIRM|nr:sugar phosphate isomerase/epimerase family protein [Absicoccus sp. CLA-KB-P134]MDX8417575.1 sugar phosphate isomerase/epimerase [Absicoccus sp. CLA-KB-P134]
MYLDIVTRNGTGDIKTHLHALENACQIAHALHCLTIRIFPFRWPDNRKGPFGTKEDMDRIIPNIKRAIEIAKSYQVTLVLENCPYSHLPKGEMTLQVVRALQSSYLKLLWDPANSYRAIPANVPKEYMHWNLKEELEHMAPYIGHIHIKDYRYDASSPKPFLHVPVGKGDIPYSDLLTSLCENGYTGSLSLEPEVDGKGSIECMRVLKKMVNNVS